MSIAPEHCPPGTTVNQPEPPSETGVEPTIAELREWSAKWLGGWPLFYFEVHLDCDGGDWPTWQPDLFIEQAWLLLAKFQTWGIDNDDGAVRCFVLNGCTPFRACEKTAPLAILKAAYRAAQGKETP